MRNRRTLSLVVMLVLAFGALAATLASGNKPELGLDLQGGASVVLQPPAGTPKGTINQAIEIIRNRVDALGVAEPQISRQGNAVVVELPYAGKAWLVREILRGAGDLVVLEPADARAAIAAEVED